MKSRADAGVTQAPPGLVYVTDFISQEEEKQVVRVLGRLDFFEVMMHGQVARRTVRHFGYDYDYTRWTVTPTEPLPSELRWLHERCAQLAGVSAAELAQILVSNYPAGAGIGWHRDAPMFGKIVGVSLASECRMRFQRTGKEAREVFAIELAPRSAYVLDGAVRSTWQHSIPATKAQRYSITFRTLRDRSRWQHEQ